MQHGPAAPSRTLSFAKLPCIQRAAGDAASAPSSTPLSQAISPEVRSVSAVVEIGLRATVRYPGL
jgi:hypothetical protein